MMMMMIAAMTKCQQDLEWPVYADTADSSGNLVLGADHRLASYIHPVVVEVLVDYHSDCSKRTVNTYLDNRLLRPISLPISARTDIRPRCNDTWFDYLCI